MNHVNFYPAYIVNLISRVARYTPSSTDYLASPIQRTLIEHPFK